VDEVDYLVLGGGSAGCVLASRLSEDPQISVALIEAGGDGASWVVETPLAGVLMAPTRLNNWAYATVPQAGLGGRVGYQPRGRALGGSSAINAMIYTRGHRADYDRWAALGNPGWSYADVLPYFKKSENNETFCDAFHDRGGPLNVTDSRTDNPFPKRFLDAAREAQLPINADFNGERQEGCGLYQVTQIDGERCSAARAYLRPHIGARANLRVETRARALRLVLEGRRVVGAEIFARDSGASCARGAKRWSVSASSARRSSSCCQAPAKPPRSARSGSRRSSTCPASAPICTTIPTLCSAISRLRATCSASPSAVSPRSSPRLRATAANGAAWSRPTAPRRADSSRRGPSSNCPTCSCISSSASSTTTCEKSTPATASPATSAR
jgi:choline dehydrogenase-like flavoprotein